MSLDIFEQSLLTELRAHVAARTPALSARSSRSFGRARRRWALAGAVPLAGAAAAAVALSLAQSPAAYAVDKTGNGDIVVTIHRLDDAAGLQKALRADGVNADVDYDATLTDQAPQAGGTGGSGDGPEVGTTSGAGDGPATDQSGQAPASDRCMAPLIQTSATKDSFTLRLPASIVDFGGVLHITTGGSLDAGVTALRVSASRPAGC